jgi:beta-lactamase regulating signal transducer with metallopeptidase domain
MQVLSQSAFLQALGYAIAGSLWQAALLWLVVAGINGLFKLSSQVKYKIALATQFGAFVWFLVSLQFYYNMCSQAIAQLQHSGLNSSNAFVFQPGTRNFSSILLSAISRGEKLLPYLSVAYLCLLAVLGIRWVKGYRQTILIKTQGLQKIDVQWRLFVKKISQLLNIKRPVKIYVSSLVKSPLTMGFLKPLILIPVASINNLTTYQLEAVILHELAHIKRADYIINIIHSIIEISLFFNPFVQLLGKIIKRERENSCDDWVLQFQYDPSAYAEALLRIACMQQTPALAMNAAGKETDLLWRVKRMLNQHQKTFQYRNRLFALLLITGLLSSVAWFNPGVKDAGAKPVANGQPVLMEPLAIKIDNPLFNPLSFLNKPFKEEVTKAAQDASVDLQQATKNIASAALQRVTPVVLDKVKTISSDLPAYMNQAANAVNTVLANFDTKTEMPKEFTDSAKVNNLLYTAVNQVKNIEWAKMAKNIVQAEKDIKTEASAKNLFASLGKLKLNDIINKSVADVQQQVNQWNIVKDESSGDDEGGDANTPIMLTGKHAAGAKLMLEQKTQKIKRRADSIRNAHAVVSAMRRKNLGDLSGDVAVQYPGLPNVYSYTTPQVAAYTPAKFVDQPAEYTTSWGDGGTTESTSNGVTVNTAAGSTLIAVKEEKDNTNSFKKKLTIETMDKNGQRHTFHIVVEVYQ